MNSNYINLSDVQLYNIVNDMDLEVDKPVEKNMDHFCKCGIDSDIITDFSIGIIVCKRCGYVTGTVIDSTAEWRRYDDSGKGGIERCTIITNPHLPKSSLSTSIGGKYKSKIGILNDWGAMPYEERSLNNVLKFIQNKCRKAKIYKCIEDDAKIMYKYINKFRYQEEGIKKGKKIIVRGVNRKSLIAACIYFACIRKNEPRSPQEIAKLFDVTYTDITNGLKKFTVLIKKNRSKKETFKFDIGTSLSEDFVPRFCKILKLDNEIIEIATTIAYNSRRLNIASTHIPISIAIGSIWLVIIHNSIKISKKKIAKTFSISEVTISKTYDTIKQLYNILSNNKKTDNILEKIKIHRKQVQLPINLAYKHMKIKIEICNKITNKINNYQINEQDIEYNKLVQKWYNITK